MAKLARLVSGEHIGCIGEAPPGACPSCDLRRSEAAYAEALQVIDAAALMRPHIPPAVAANPAAPGYAQTRAFDEAMKEWNRGD